MHVADSQLVAITGATITDTASHTDESRNYRIATDNVILTILPAPLTLRATTVNVEYDGLAHTPNVYAPKGMQAGILLMDYALIDAVHTKHRSLW